MKMKQGWFNTATPDNLETLEEIEKQVDRVVDHFSSEEDGSESTAFIERDRLIQFVADVLEAKDAALASRTPRLRC